jgi:hypothetical protein
MEVGKGDIPTFGVFDLLHEPIKSQLLLGPSFRGEPNARIGVTGGDAAWGCGIEFK